MLMLLTKELLELSKKYLLFFMVFFCHSTFAQNSLIDVKNYQALTSDRRAIKVGDILTVIVTESTSATTAVGTNAKNKTNFTLTANMDTSKADAGLALEGGASGEGQTSRKGKLQTIVSVQVKEKSNDGLLKVEGLQELVVNNDKQTISISGYVRSDDINYDNTIYSYRLSDAIIKVSGKGIVDDSQNLSIFLSSFSLVEINLMWKIFALSLTLLISTNGYSLTEKVRIKDLVRIQDDREQVLVGYGLVVGLSRSGDSDKNSITRQALVNTLKNFNVNVNPNELSSRNSAAVIVTAKLPAFSEIGDRFDVEVSSIGDARSLSGGTLVLTPLYGPDKKNLCFVSRFNINWWIYI